MGKTNHKGIPVKSSTYPEDWNPSSLNSYNNFMSHVVLQNLKNEGKLVDMPSNSIEIRSCKPVQVGKIIRDILASQDAEMTGLIYQANSILKGGQDDI